MTNFEKYKDEITNITDCSFGVVDGRPFSCSSIRCKDCEIQYNKDCEIQYNNDCLRSRWLWLISEYEELKKINIPEDMPIDAKVLVSVNGKYWTKRHYAGFKDGKHYVWSSGKTSWTCEPDEISQWEYMKLYE